MRLSFLMIFRNHIQKYGTYIAWLCCLVILMTSGINCTKNNADAAYPITVPEIKQSNLSQYNEYILLMKEQQRYRFLQLNNDVEREQFLILHNLDLQKYLANHLYFGMLSKQVADVLGPPITKETTLTVNQRQTRWEYCSFQGQRSRKYNICFKQDQLYFWEIQNE